MKVTEMDCMIFFKQMIIRDFHFSAIILLRKRKKRKNTQKDQDAVKRKYHSNIKLSLEFIVFAHR